MNILHEDYHLIALAKPAGLLTQAPPDIPSLEATVKAYIKAKDAKPAGVYLGVPHRLDRPVSGVVVFARNTKAAQRLAAQFHDRTVQKVYWAAIEGPLPEGEHLWEDWLRKVPTESRTEIATAGEPGVKLATLQVRVLHLLPNGRSLIELRPTTGRSHQLRVQAASRGYPIVGDEQYGSTHQFGPPAELPRDRVIALHARCLTIEHPTRHEPLTFTAPLPDYWAEIGVPDEVFLKTPGTESVQSPASPSS